MRTSKRFLPAVGATALAALLAACGSPPQQAGSYPTAPYPTASNYPATPMPGQTYPGSAQTIPAVELGRVTDIQTVAMGQTGTANPNASRDAAIAGGVIGAVVGNVIGKNVNNGHNRTGTTVLGGAAGAAIGSSVGGRNDSSNTATAGAGAGAYRVTVQTDNGSRRIYEVGTLGDLRVGDRVRVENGVIYRS
jgi:uncharacterized protein YcfJ